MAILLYFRVRVSPPKKPGMKASWTMAKTLHEILQMTWQRQVEELQNLTPKEIGILFWLLSRMPVEEKDREAFDRFYLAVAAILREYLEIP